MSSPRQRRPGELAFAGAIAVFSLAALWQAHAISGFAGLARPGVFPMLAAGTMVLAAAVIVRDTLRLRAGAGAAARRFFAEVLPLRLVAIIGLMAAYLALMPWFGFLPSSAAFLFAALALLWRRNLFWTALLTAVSLAAIYLVFRIVFQVVLPQGTLVRGLF